MTEINIDNKKGDLPPKNAFFILAGSLLLGMLFNMLFYKEIPGVSCFIFVFAFYIVFYKCFKSNFIPKLTISNILIMFIMLLTATYGIHSNPILLAINLLAIPTLIAAQTILFTGKNLFKWHTPEFILDIIYSVLYGGLAYIHKSIQLIIDSFYKNPNRKRHSTISKIFVGLIISLPLLIVIIGLLSSADLVFKNIMDNLSGFFVNLKLNSLMTQAILVLIVALLIFSYLWYLSIPQKRDCKIQPINELKDNGVMDPIIIITVLVMICLIYSLFIFIQFAYLFGSAYSKLPAALTYSEYARRGFFELVLVTLINLSIVLINVNLSKHKTEGLNKLLQGLNTFLILCTLVILFSAHLRMTLYEKIYGYTYLRFFTHTFMVYILILLITASLKVWYKKLSLAKVYLIISLIAYTAINYVNADAIIANKNLERYHKTGKIDVYYLSRLSYDAVPQMLSLYNDLKTKGNPEALKLENQLYFTKHSLSKWTHWQSFNYSVDNAKKLLKDYNFKQANPKFDTNQE